MLEQPRYETSMTRTENGALAYGTTGSFCLDFFASCGALRNADENDILSRFYKAFFEDRLTALKTLFYARDVLGGLGERRVFRIILQDLAQRHPEAVLANLERIPELGRYDDLFVLLDTPCIEGVVQLVSRQLAIDLDAHSRKESVSLLAKWMPSENASSEETKRKAKKLRRALGFSSVHYRQILSALRAGTRLIENSLREKDYTFDYSMVPSKAMWKYRRAFSRNDGERYEAFMQEARENPSLIKTATLTPVDVVHPLYQNGVLRYWGQSKPTAEEIEAADITWNALENFCGDENALVVADGSGSMYGFGDPAPIEVAMSLAIYIAQRNTGRFANHFITFSNKPKLVEVSGDTIFDQLFNCMKCNECANTNIEAVFRLILDTAKKYRIPREELPSRLYILSDMEFDEGTNASSLTIFQSMKEQYEKAGYTLPQVVYWNLQSRHAQFPVTFNEQQVMLVSGYSPRILKIILSQNCTPWQIMTECLSSDRYARIVTGQRDENAI